MPGTMREKEALIADYIDLGFKREQFPADLTDVQYDNLKPFHLMMLANTYLVTHGTRGATLEQIMELIPEQREKFTSGRVGDIQFGTTTFNIVLREPPKPEISLEEANAP